MIEYLDTLTRYKTGIDPPLHTVRQGLDFLHDKPPTVTDSMYDTTTSYTDVTLLEGLVGIRAGVCVDVRPEYYASIHFEGEQLILMRRDRRHHCDDDPEDEWLARLEAGLDIIGRSKERLDYNRLVQGGYRYSEILLYTRYYLHFLGLSDKGVSRRSTKAQREQLLQLLEDYPQLSDEAGRPL